MTPRKLAPLLAIASIGCAVHHLDANAPGHIDVLEPPHDRAARTAEPPKDPGEDMIVFTYGVLAGGGVAAPKDENVKGAYGIGPEASLHVGGSDYSHMHDADPVLPYRAVGFNLGWTALSRPGEGVGPIYGELQYREEGYWLAGGWAYDPDDQLHGPQATIGLGPLYLRVTELFDFGPSFQAGLVLKGSQTWVKSR